MAAAAAEEDWTSSAMSDGGVVAELLVRLKEAKVSSVLLKNRTVTSLRWGIRQPRSRCLRKEAESRCSPSTPLSWSGGYGGSSSSSPPSAYVDGNEATSRRLSGSFAVGSSSKGIASVRSPFIENKRLKRMKLNAEVYTSLAVETCKEDGNFLLPDLNIMPCDENGDNYSSLAVG